MRARDGRAAVSTAQTDEGRIFSRDVIQPGATSGGSTQGAASSGLSIREEAPLTWRRHPVPVSTVGPMGEAVARRMHRPSRNAAQQDSYNNMQSRMRAAAHSSRGNNYHRVPPPTAQNAAVPSYRPPGNTGLYDELLADAARHNPVAHAHNVPQDLAARPGGAVRGVAQYMHDGMGAVPYFANNALQGIWNMLGLGNYGNAFRTGGAQGYHANPYPGTAVSAADEKRRRAKKYSVRQSHPHYTRKMQGFSRDVIPLPDPDETEEEKVSSLPDVATAPLPRDMRRTSRKGKQAASRNTDLDDDDYNITDIPVPPAIHNADGIIDEDDFEMEQLVTLDDRSKAAEAAAARQMPVIDTQNADIPILDLDTEGSGTASTSSSTANTLKSTSTTATSLPENNEPETRLHQTQKASSSPDVELVVPLKAKTKIFAAVCASCVQPLYLHQSASFRPFLLLCGHVVCHKCLHEATRRADKLANEPAILLDEEPASGQSSWAGTPFNESFEEVSAATVGQKASRGTKRKRGVTSINVPRKITSSRRGRGATASRGRGRGRKLAEAQAADDPSSEYEPSDAPSQSNAMDAKVSASASRVPTRPGRRRRQPPAAADASDEEPLPERLRDGEDDTYKPSVTRASGDEDEPDGLEEQPPTKGKGRAFARTKAAKATGIETNPAWVTCPIVGCKGEQTDLLAKAGSRRGAWEMFV